MPEWQILPSTDQEHWLYVDGDGGVSLARVYEKNGKAWMVIDGYRMRVRYGRWFPLGPVPSIGEISSRSASEKRAELRGLAPHGGNAIATGDPIDRPLPFELQGR